MNTKGVKFEERILEALKKNDFQKRADALAKKYKDKKVMIYGGGTLFEIILENFDLKDLNIIGIADKRFYDGKELKGYKTFNSDTFLSQKPDIVLIALQDTKRIEKFFKQVLFPKFGKFKYELLVKDSIKIKDEYCIHFGAVRFNNDGLITQNNCDFTEEPLFKESFKQAEQTGAWKDILCSPIWRCYICCCAAKHGLNYEGDFVECGVARGAMSRAAMHYTNFKQQKDRTFWLFDTFNGLDVNVCNEKEKKDSEVLIKYYGNLYDAAVNTFKEFDNVKIVQGSVMETLEQFTGDKIVYLSIDMNCVIPEVTAINFFWDKLVRGCMVVLDDYGFPGREEQKWAMDEFVKKAGAQVISLPTGQGLIIKP